MWSPTWIGERMRGEGLITQAQLESATQNMRLYNERMEEALIRIGAVDEAALLRFVAERCRTRFVSSGKLAQLDVPEEVLAKLPLRLAEKLLAFPVRYERGGDSLSIVAPDAGDPEWVKQAGIATGQKNLKAYVARPAAVRAAIDKWYKGQIQSFAMIAPDTFTQIQGVDLAERPRAQPPRARAVAAAPNAPSPEYFVTPLPVRPPTPVRRAELPEPREPEPSTPPPPPSSPAPASSPAVGAITAELDAIAPPPRAPGVVDRRLTDLTELLNVLVALGETSRDEFRGHSASVARFSRMLVERMGLGELAATHATIAANLHDLGKPVSYHLTALNVAQYATHKNAAQKLAQTPARLVGSVGLPQEAIGAASAMYERFDGTGFPEELAGKQIPLGARILALCDTYSDLTLNPRNLMRKALTHGEALAVLEVHRGKIFDPDLIDLLDQCVGGEDLRRRLADDKPLVLLIEPNAEEATIMELRLVAQGFDVRIARSADSALHIALGGGVSFVLSEVELQPFDGFELLRRLRADEGTRALTFLFVARASDSASIDRAFSLGAQDYVVKPTSGDVLAGKLRRLSATAPTSKRPDVTAGVAGSLSEMALPDLVQILGQGRKSGRLRVRSSGREGEIHLRDGRIVHAVQGELAGSDAFFELLGFAGGTFALDPAFVPTEESIQGSSEMLVLEGLRRLDERNRP
jgi:response regulator RpfG family c-di-GMP phosphodiesterase